MKIVTVKISPQAEREIKRFLVVRRLAGQDVMSDSFTARVVNADDGAEVEIKLLGEKKT